MSRFIPPGLGWHRDLPDPRDYTPKHDHVVKLLHDLDPAGERSEQVDLREFCPEIESQGRFAASSVHACLSMVLYFERRVAGRVLEPSRMFVYHIAKQTLGWLGDSGLPLRATLKAIARFGLPPERIWAYDQDHLDVEPQPFVYASAHGLNGALYVRLDARGERPENTLEDIRRFLNAGLVCVCGFPVSTAVKLDSEIPFPTVFDGIRGGQAAMVAGYDDNRRIRSDRGALLIANSWGDGWGDQGYGWLPYAYVREELAADFWTFLTPGWLSSGEFGRPV